jgi:PadR family transcriptional regulator, regulatory protein AphA
MLHYELCHSVIARLLVSDKLPESTYAVLGLVDKVPGSSGYDLLTVAGRSFAYFWPISQTLLYRELNRLTNLGWVTATRVEQVRTPSKWIYTITEDGQSALTEWLASPPQGSDTFRSPLLLRFFFAHRMSSSDLSDLLSGYRRALEAEHEELQAIVDKLAKVSTPGARSGRLTALFGLRTAAARLQWVDEMQAETEQDGPSRP